jgi:hypothetical protein
MVPSSWNESGPVSRTSESRKARSPSEALRIVSTPEGRTVVLTIQLVAVPVVLRDRELFNIADIRPLKCIV